MCGIVGALDPSASRSEEELAAIAARMSSSLSHRGPDDHGTWTLPAVGLLSGFRRLSILDLSPAGHQPMGSRSGRYTCVFNGEIYNHRALRAELEAQGHRFRGHSDTEVLLAAFDNWGIQSSLERFNGMFAIAVWDVERHELNLIRDRIGEKPLYYGFAGQTLLFSSELKALLHHPDFVPEIDRDALAAYVRFNYIPAPSSIYRGIAKLHPGGRFTYRPGETGRLTSYWSLEQKANAGVTDPLPGDEEMVARSLDELLRDAVKIRMEADVPLGAMLSGGIDSSVVVAMMQDQSVAPVKTFTIGFHEAEYDEAPHAAAVAAHLGTEHTELYVTPTEALDVVPRLPAIYDEPFGDLSQIPTFLVSQLASRRVTVSLSGDGGDELFGGYNRYLLTPKIWNVLRRVPFRLRRSASRGIHAVASRRFGALAGRLLPSDGNIAQGTLPSRLRSLADLVVVRDERDMYLRLLTMWDDDELVVGGRSDRRSHERVWADMPTDVEAMMLFDALTYLPDDILVKVDRATMANSLEGRMPLLDHRVVETAWRMPLSLKVPGKGPGKHILQKVLHRYVPASLVDRPKMGFGVPMDAWLRGPLLEWAEDLLAPDVLASDGYFNPLPIRARWRQHVEGVRDRQYELWTILMFQAWLHHDHRLQVSAVESR